MLVILVLNSLVDSVNVVIFPHVLQEGFIFSYKFEHSSSSFRADSRSIQRTKLYLCTFQVRE